MNFRQIFNRREVDAPKACIFQGSTVFQRKPKGNLKNVAVPPSFWLKKKKYSNMKQ